MVVSISCALGGTTHSIAYRCPMSTSCLRPGVPAAPAPVWCLGRERSAVWDNPRPSTHPYPHPPIPSTADVPCPILLEARCPCCPCPCVMSRQGEERCVGQSSGGGLRHTATPPPTHFSVSSLSLVTAGSRAGARVETPSLQHTAPLSSSLWYTQLQTVNCDENWNQQSLPQPARCLVKIGCELLCESHHLYVESKFWCCQFYYDSNSSTAQTQYCRRWGYSPLTLAILHIAITGTYYLK